VMNEPIADGPSRGHIVDRAQLDAMLDDYYAARGWDAQGVPTAESARRLGIEHIVGDLG
jgi:aldehyde:ferredoxin oxidoreductase